MNKKIIIVVVVFLLFVAGGIFWWWQENQKEIESKVQIQVIDTNHQSVVALKDGAKITAPHGSVPTDTIITAQVLDPATVPNLPEWSKQAISLYEFSVDKPLQSSVTIQIPLPKDNNNELSLLGHYHNGFWEIMPFIVKGETALVKTKNLSLFGWLGTDGKWFLSFLEKVGPPSEKILDMTFGNVIKAKKWVDGKTEESVYWLFGNKVGKFYHEVSVAVKLFNVTQGDSLAYAELLESGELDRKSVV